MYLRSDSTGLYVDGSAVSEDLWLLASEVQQIQNACERMEALVQKLIHDREAHND